MVKMRMFTTAFFLCTVFFTSFGQDGAKLDFNTNVNYRTIEGIDGGNFLDISMRPTLTVPGFMGTQFFINIPYNLSTNKIRKIDLKIGNAFKYAYLGNETAFISAGALENFSMGFSNLVVNNYNNQLDETNKRVGAYGNINYGGFTFSAMANDVVKPQVFAGSAGFELPIMGAFKVNVTGGIDTDPDNNSATSKSVAAYGVDLYSDISIDENNYFYAVGGVAQIQENGNGQVGLLGARFGTAEYYLNLEGAIMRLGPGFEWGFFDTFYERDRKLGTSKADSLYAKNPKASGGTNFNAFLGYKTDNPGDFSLQAGGYYFTNYSGTELNEFAGLVQLTLPRSLIGEEGELASATFIIKTKAFEDIAGLIKRLQKPDNRTVITLDAPITIMNDLLGMGRLAFVLNYSWNYVYQTSSLSFIPQKNLIYGFRLISNI